MPNWSDGDGGCDCPSGNAAGLGYHREGQPGCCMGPELRKKKNVATKKKKKTEHPDWLYMWTDANIDELKKLEHGWATIHPEHGIINHDTVGLIHLFGKNRFIKRSIMKVCVHIDVAASLRTYATLNPFHAAFEGIKKAFKKPFEPLTIKEIEEERVKMRADAKEAKKPKDALELLSEDVAKMRPDGLPNLTQPVDLFDNNVVFDGAAPPSEVKESEKDVVTLATFAQKHSLKATDVLLKLLGHGMTGIHIHTVLDFETLTKLEEEFGVIPGLPAEAKTSPHKQPPYKPYKPGGFDRGIVLDGYGNRARANKMRVD